MALGIHEAHCMVLGEGAFLCARYPWRWKGGGSPCMDVGLHGCHRVWIKNIRWCGYPLGCMEVQGPLMQGAGVGINGGLSVPGEPFMSIKAPLTMEEGTVLGGGGAPL